MVNTLCPESEGEQNKASDSHIYYWLIVIFLLSLYTLGKGIIPYKFLIVVCYRRPYAAFSVGVDFIPVRTFYPTSMTTQ